MTPDDLARDRAILAAASPLHWAGGEGYEQSDPGYYVAAASGDVVCASQDGTDCPLTKENRDAIAHAVNRLPDYIAESEEMRRRIAEIEKAIELAGAQADVDPWGDAAPYRNGMLAALRILRGEK